MDKITLATLPEASAQEVFDQVRDHLLRQKVRSTTYKGICAYRINRRGSVLKCAAGCLIADDEYDPGWEGIPWKFLNELPRDHVSLIVALQDVHDALAPELWEAELSKVAESFSLESRVS